jgi:chitin synthase
VLRRFWALYNDDVYDLSDYFNTLTIFQNAQQYEFIDSDVTDLFKQQPGQDLTKPLNALYANMDSGKAHDTQNCLVNTFLVGHKDFRKDAQCQVANVLMLVASIILVSSMAVKCTSSARIRTAITTDRLCSPSRAAALTAAKPGAAGQVRDLSDPVLHRG